MPSNVSEIVASIHTDGFLALPISHEHAASVCTLPPYHRDPFDRILIAQAISEPLTLLTADHALQQYSPLIYIV